MNSENNVQGVEERSTMADLKNNFFYANWMIAQKSRRLRRKQGPEGGISGNKKK